MVLLELRVPKKSVNISIINRTSVINLTECSIKIAVLQRTNARPGALLAALSSVSEIV